MDNEIYNDNNSQIIIRDFKPEDEKFVRKLIDDGIKGGHFIDKNNKKLHSGVSSLHENIMRAIEEKEIAIRTPSGKIYTGKISVKIAELQNQKSGVLIVKHDVGGIELWILAVEKDFRRKGIATYLISHEIESVKSGVFYARCLKKSTYAMKLLEKIGFERVGNDATGMVGYKYQK